MRQHDAVIVIAIYEFVMCAMLLLISCVVLPIALVLTPVSSDGWGEFVARFVIVGLLLAATFGIGIASGIVGVGLLNRREWARVGAIVLAIIGLVGFPIWTIIGILILFYLLGEEGRAQFGHTPRVRASATAAGSPTIVTDPTEPPVTEDEFAPEQTGATDATLRLRTDDNPTKPESD
ncbi:MAG TPA: hypothetical protein VHA53_04555 [Nitrolancea sp.]|nr:hypothetical protein [Nitrolancea sp.]